VITPYRVKDQILDVLAEIGPEVAAIYVVDDCCPSKSGDWVESHCNDPRIKVLRHDKIEVSVARHSRAIAPLSKAGRR
jgi:dolichol-phosphate mannosyltransferase